VPDHVVAVGKDGGGESRAIISSNADHHQSGRENKEY
jgi:hypothetical protein